MKKNISSSSILIISVLFISLIFTACSENEDTKKSKMRVVLSSFVLYDIATHLAGETFELVSIIPPGIDIHSYEPTPQMMSKIETSDLVFYNGVGLEPWLSSFTFKQRAIAIGNYVRIRALDADEFDKHEHHDHQCAHSSLDPHIWFDIENMKKTTDIMTYEFISLQPQHKELYLDNRDKYIAALEALDMLYKSRLQSCSLDTIITNHNAFSYLSNRYGFHIKTLSGLSSDKEVSPKDIIRVLNDIKEHNAPVIFFENFGSDKSMKSLASQASVKVDSLHPLGNITKDDAKMDRTYEDIMKENLDKISKALVCQ